MGQFYDPVDGEAIQFIGLFLRFQREGLGVTEAHGVALNTFLTGLGMYALAEWPDADVHRVDRLRRAVIECAEVLLGAVGLSHAPVEAVGKGDGRSDDQAANPGHLLDTPQPTGFHGVLELVKAFGVDPSQVNAFAKQLERKRRTLGDDNWTTVANRKGNSPHFLYRAESAAIRALAAGYLRPKSA